MTPAKFQELALSADLRELADLRDQATELLADLQRKRVIVAAHANLAAAEDQVLLATIDAHLSNARACIASVNRAELEVKRRGLRFPIMEFSK